MQVYCVFIDDDKVKAVFLDEYAATWKCRELLAEGYKNVFIRTGTIKLDKLKDFKR